MVPLDGERRLNSAMMLIRSSRISASRKACRGAPWRAACASDWIFSRGACVFEIARLPLFFSIISVSRLMISLHCCPGGIGSSYQTLKFLQGSTAIDALFSQLRSVAQVFRDAANFQCGGRIYNHQISRGVLSRPGQNRFDHRSARFDVVTSELGYFAARQAE